MLHAGTAERSKSIGLNGATTHPIYTRASPPPRYEVLRRVPILFALSDRQLWQLARLLQPAAFKKGATVFRVGDEADAFYIVQSGAFTCFTSASGGQGGVASALVDALLHAAHQRRPSTTFKQMKARSWPALVPGNASASSPC